MKKADITTLIVTTVLCLLPLLLSAVVYAELPAQIPYHWDISGQPNSWIPKEYVWVFPAGMAVMNIIIEMVVFRDPKRAGVSKVFTRIVFWIMPVIALILYPVMIFYALGVNIPVTLAAFLIVGILVLIFGNYMPKTRQNNTVGLRIPWTLKNEENWNKTHRLAGKLWTAGGMLLIIAAFTMQSIPAFMFGLLLIVIALVTIIPIAYSYTLYKKQKHTED